MYDIFSLRFQDSVTLHIILQICIRELEGNGCVYHDLRMQENCTMTQTSCKVCFTISTVWKTRSCLLSVETSLHIPSIYCTALDNSINKPATSIVHLLWDGGRGGGGEMGQNRHLIYFLPWRTELRKGTGLWLYPETWILLLVSDPNSCSTRNILLQ
jgi:hypothetical protein